MYSGPQMNRNGSQSILKGILLFYVFEGLIHEWSDRRQFDPGVLGSTLEAGESPGLAQDLGPWRLEASNEYFGPGG